MAIWNDQEEKADRVGFRVEDGVTGFVFRHYDAGSFVGAVIRALRTWRDRPAWDAMVRAAMRRDFGWERSEERYLEVYRRVLARAERGADVPGA